MNNQMLTISEAASLTKKHPNTIRRLIKQLLETDKEASNKITQERATKGFIYRIEQRYLLDSLQINQNDNHESNQTSELIALLRAEIEDLKKQRDIKDQQIANFQERDREHNILMSKLQEQLPTIEAPKEKPHKRRGFLWLKK